MLRTPAAGLPPSAARDPRPSEPKEPLVRSGLRAFLDLDLFDVIAVVVLVVVSFGLRFASPIYPDFLDATGGVRASGVGHPYNATECTSLPVGPAYRDVSRCGFVFDEIYFPVDA